MKAYIMGNYTEKAFQGFLKDPKTDRKAVVEQLTKRPGSHLISALSPSTAANSKWFTIYTRDDESYIGQVAADGGVKIFRCSDGVEIPVDYANIAGSGVATYLDNTALSDVASHPIPQIVSVGYKIVPSLLSISDAFEISLSNFIVILSIKL